MRNYIKGYNQRHQSQDHFMEGTAKVHKLKEKEGVDKLTLRPIISNAGTVTYEIAGYLAEFLAPLGKSKHTISNTKDFITRLKTERIPKRFKIISFDIKS